MTSRGGATREQPAVDPSVGTAPAPGAPHRWWSAIPRHLGRARTSTVVLVVLFLAIGVLYLYAKPEETAATTSGGEPAVNQPAPTTGGATSTAPATTTAPVPTTTAPAEPTTSAQATTDPPAGRAGRRGRRRACRRPPRRRRRCQRRAHRPADQKRGATALDLAEIRAAIAVPSGPLASAA